MGCCTSTKPGAPPKSPPKPAQTKPVVSCVYENETLALNTTNLVTIRDSLRARFPVLKFRSFRLYSREKEVNSAEELQQAAAAGKVELRVRVEAGVVSEASAKVQVHAGVLIVAEGDVVVGTGFVISAEIAVIATEDVRNRVTNENFRLIKPGHEDEVLRFRKPGVCVELAVEGGVHICAVQLAKSVPHIPVLRLQSTSAQPSSVRAFFVSPTQFTRQRPVLQCEDLTPLVVRSETTFGAAKSLREGATGAPVVTPEGDLVGVYVTVQGESDGVVVAAKGLFEQLWTQVQKGTSEEKDAFSYMFPEVTAQDEVVAVAHAAPAASSRPPQPDPHLHENPPVKPEDVSVTLPTAPEPEPSTVDLPDPYYRISLSEGEVTRLDSLGKALASVTIPLPLISGYCATFTPKGLFVTGCDAGNRIVTLLLSETRMEQLESSRWTHNFHVSLWLQGKVLVVSGLNSESVERYSFAQKYWIQGPNISHSRAYGCGTVLDNSAYILGGLGRNLRRYKRSVYKFADERWTKLPIRIDFELQRCGCLPLSSSFVVFGGLMKTEAGGTLRNAVVDVNLRTGATTQTESNERLGDFCAGTCGAVSGKWLAISDQGEMYRFLPETRTFSSLNH